MPEESAVFIAVFGRWASDDCKQTVKLLPFSLTCHSTVYNMRKDQFFMPLFCFSTNTTETKSLTSCLL